MPLSDARRSESGLVWRTAADSPAVARVHAHRRGPAGGTTRPARRSLSGYIGAQEILLLDVDDLDMANKRALVIGKGGNAERVGWETATARLLPRYLAGRRAGPLFLSSIAPAPARQPASADAERRTGRVRLSYRRAAELFAEGSGGWTLHQLRHSRLTHLAEAGVTGPLLMAKSRHGSMRTLGIYAKPTFDAVAEATARLDPARRRLAPD